MSYNLTSAAQGGNFVLARAGGATANLVIGTTSVNVTLQNMTYSIKGALKYLASATLSSVGASATDLATGLAFKPITTSTACALTIGINAAGTLGIAQGKVVPVSDTTAGSTVCPLGILPDTYAPVSYVVVVAGSTASAAGWVPGTNNWTGVTGITAAAGVDLFTMPNTDPTN